MTEALLTAVAVATTIVCGYQAHKNRQQYYNMKWRRHDR